MTKVPPISHQQLGRRRQYLRRQRRHKITQMVGQITTVSLLSYGLLWALSHPIWQLQKPSQIKIVGNQLLNPKIIRSMLGLTYPQSLWEIHPQILAQRLESPGAIAEANVTRHLFPPGLTITIIERHPVALAWESNPLDPTGNSPEKVGWLDTQGNWMPLNSYQGLDGSPTFSPSVRQKLQTHPTLPKLKVIGKIDQYRHQWPSFYQALSQTNIAIQEINWQNPSNIILTTELGSVHLGAIRPHLERQFQALNRMGQLSQKINSAKVDYIDLKNPDSPSIHLPVPAKTSNSTRSTSP